MTTTTEKSPPTLREALEAGWREHPQAGWEPKDVAELLAGGADTSPAGAEYLWLLKLKDGRFVAARGGHEPRGWGGMSNLSSSVHDSSDDALRWGFGDSERERLVAAAREPEATQPEAAH